MAQSPQPPVKLNIGTAKEAVKLQGFLHDDFPIIRQACITFAFCAVLALLLIGSSHFFYLQQKERQDQAQTELAQAQGKYDEASNKKNDIQEFQPRYLQLIERGFVGEEKRLDVVELIQAIQAKYRLLPMTYEISPQQIVQLDPATSTGELELHASKVLFRMNLLHEMDMLNLFKELRERGQFIHQSCSIKNTTAMTAINTRNLLDAECSLQWVTMGRRPAAETPAPAATP